MPRKGLFRRRRAVHWWTSEIVILCGQCVAAQRAYQRAGRCGRADDRSAEAVLFRRARKTLCIAIRRSQGKCWAELSARVEHDLWGLPYRIVAKGLVRVKPGSVFRGLKNELMSHLFPSLPTMLEDWLSIPLGPVLLDEVVPRFTLSELNTAAKRLLSGKAFGPGSVPNEVLSVMYAVCPNLHLEVYNMALISSRFPEVWKIARLVFLHKGPGKLLDNLSSFRPLCMLDAAGKQLERLLLSRLTTHVEATGGLSARQFGFKPGRSTADAIRTVLAEADATARGPHRSKQFCLMVTLDVRNGFNLAP